MNLRSPLKELSLKQAISFSPSANVWDFLNSKNVNKNHINIAHSTQKTYHGWSLLP